MIIWFNPMLSVENINADSNYVLMNRLLTQVTKERSDLYFIVPFPYNPPFKYVRDGFFDNPQVIRIPKYHERAKRHNNISFDAKFWMKLYKEYPPDLIYNNVVEYGHLLKLLFPGFTKTAHPPVVNHHHYTIHKSLPYPLFDQMHLYYSQIISSILVDFNVFQTSHSFKMLTDNYAEIDWEYGHKKLRENYAIIPSGIIDAELFEQYRQEKYDQTTILYNHRFQDYKKYTITLKVLKELYNEGHKFKLIVTYGVGDNLTRAKKLPFCEIKKLPTQAEYLAEVSKCHINSINSLHELQCYAIIESMYYNTAIVAPNGITFPELLGDEYPYLFDSVPQQKAMLASLIDHPEDQAQIGEYCHARAKRVFSVEEWGEKFIALVESITEQYNALGELKDKNRKSLMNILKSAENVKIEDLSRIITKLNLSQQSMPKVRLSNVLRSLGFTAKILNKKPIWVKENALDT